MNSATKYTMRPLAGCWIPILFFMGWMLLLGSLTLADDQARQDIVVSRIVSVYDGDTFRCDVDAWPAIVGYRIGVRINGIDTPEITDKRSEYRIMAQAAKQFAADKLMAAKVVELRNIKRGKYFRILADVYVDGKSLGAMLLEAGLARPYFGGKR